MLKKAIVTLMVSDFDRALSFYTHTLGFPLKERYGNEWAEVSAPGVAIGLHPAAEGQPPQAGTSSIGLEVDDIDLAVTTLEAKGVIFGEAIRDSEAIRIISFRDPDGHELYLAQMVKWG